VCASFVSQYYACVHVRVGNISLYFVFLCQFDFYVNFLLSEMTYNVSSGR